MVIIFCLMIPTIRGQNVSNCLVKVRRQFAKRPHPINICYRKANCLSCALAPLNVSVQYLCGNAKSRLWNGDQGERGGGKCVQRSNQFPFVLNPTTQHHQLFERSNCPVKKTHNFDVYAICIYVCMCTCITCGIGGVSASRGPCYFSHTATGCCLFMASGVHLPLSNPNPILNPNPDENGDEWWC